MRNRQVKLAPRNLVDDNEPRSELLKYLDRLIYTGQEIFDINPELILDRVKQAIHYKPMRSDEQLMVMEFKMDKKIIRRDFGLEEYLELIRGESKTTPSTNDFLD